MSARIDLVSPLPPVRSGIADYALDLLPALAERTEVRVLRLPGQPVDERILEHYRPEPVSELDPADEDRVPLYQMGNNEHHLGVWEAAMETPGVLVLHDLVLHHFLYERTLGESDFEGYRAQLTHDHGWIGEAASMPRRWGAYGDAAHFELPARRQLLRRQRGVLVHSAWAASELREEDPELRVRGVPMAIPLPEPPAEDTVRAFRRRLGIPDRAVLVGSFGFQTPIKRTPAAVRALARPELANAHLLIGGEVAPVLDLESEARIAGVAARVHRLGFLPYREWETAITACDACINLRYPSAGETSASLLRVLALGRPAAVSEYGQFRDLPEEAVVHIPLGEGEEDALAGRIAALVSRPERIERAGAAARAYVRKRHDPVDAAEAVIAACEAWARMEPPGDEPARPAAPTPLTWRRLPATLEVEGDHSWSPGERRSLRVRVGNESRARWLPAAHGSGGVALAVEVRAAERQVFRRWLPLRRPVPPDESVVFELDLRRPPGPARCRIEPQVLGVEGFGALGGPVWERHFDG